MLGAVLRPMSKSTLYCIGTLMSDATGLASFFASSSALSCAIPSEGVKRATIASAQPLGTTEH